MFKKNLLKLLKKPSEYYNGCTEMPLVNFCKVINTGSYEWLQKKKGFREHEKELIIWGEIILEYGKLDNNNQIQDSFDKAKNVMELENSYNTIKAMIKMLMIVTPTHEKYGEKANEVVNMLAKMGYKIDLSNSDKYKESVLAANKRSNSLLTHIRMKKNALRGENDEKGINYDEIMAMLQTNFNVDESLTVARYLSMKKIIEKKYASRKARHEN